MKKIILIMVAFSLILATVTTALSNCSEHHICMHTQAIVRTMTTSTTAYAVHNHVPNNHNIQERAITLAKNHEFANSADYMEGLTASSKRSVYVGDAERRFSVRINI